jgi:hypothetical protein
MTDPLEDTDDNTPRCPICDRTWREHPGCIKLCEENRSLKNALKLISTLLDISDILSKDMQSLLSNA